MYSVFGDGSVSFSAPMFYILLVYEEAVLITTEVFVRQHKKIS